MLKLFLFGIGFILIFEGLTYFIFSNKIQNILKEIKKIKPENIRFFSSILIILGLCLIYFTFKIYGI